MNTYSSADIVNVGWGKDISIAELAETVCEVVGFEGEIKLDRDKPDGAPRKLLDTSRLMALGWQPTITLDAGIASTYDWYCSRA